MGGSMGGFFALAAALAYPQIGHFPFLEQPDNCAELIFDFLAQ